MRKGSTNSAMNMLKDNMYNEVPPLNKITLKQLKQKHPQDSKLYPEVLLSNIPEKNTSLKLKGGTFKRKKPVLKAHNREGPS